MQLIAQILHCIFCFFLYFDQKMLKSYHKLVPKHNTDSSGIIIIKNFRTCWLHTDARPSPFPPSLVFHFDKLPFSIETKLRQSKQHVHTKNSKLFYTFPSGCLDGILLISDMLSNILFIYYVRCTICYKYIHKIGTSTYINIKQPTFSFPAST